MTGKGKGARIAGASARVASTDQTKGPNPIDVHVGTRVRLRRTELKMSQGKLGDQVGLTFQQIQKYERGMNRIGASRLYEFSTILEVPISYFFDDMAPDTISQSAARFEDLSELSDLGPETLRLVKMYYRISPEAVRRRLYEVVKAVAHAEG